MASIDAQPERDNQSASLRRSERHRWPFIGWFLVCVGLLGGLGNPVAARKITPDKLQLHMQRMLNVNDQWRTPNPDYDPAKGGPTNYGLRFHLQPDGKHVTGTLTGIFDDDREVTYWSLLVLYNPVTEKVITQQIGWDGTLLYGEVPVQIGATQVIDQVRYGADGAMRIVRHENRFADSTSHSSLVFERGPDGWTQQQQWEWHRVAVDDVAESPEAAADEPSSTPIDTHAGYLLAGSGRWRAPNPDYTPGSGEPEQFGMNYHWGPHRRHIVGEIVSIDEKGRTEKDWSLYITYNPVTETAYLEQTGRSGIYFRGELGRTGNGRHAQSGLIYFPDGTVKSVHDEVEVIDAGTRVSHVYERDATGNWKKVRQWTWTVLP